MMFEGNRKKPRFQGPEINMIMGSAETDVFNVGIQRYNDDITVATGVAILTAKSKVRN